MLKLATVLDNPGEPIPDTRYRDAVHLKELGYNGLVIYQTVGLSGVDSPAVVGTGEMHRWVEHQFDQVKTAIEQARAGGLEVYIAYDVLSLPMSVVDDDPKSYLCKNRTDVLCPASDVGLQRSVLALERLLGALPAVDGVVLRFGDSNAPRLPYLVGNDIYAPHCARCSAMTPADRILSVLQSFYDLVVTKMDKRLIARAWNVRPGGMHDSVEIADEIVERLPGDADDPRLILSFKFTQTDFWRYQLWNPSSLRFGKRPIIYELQCQREFEGKGGIPNWQPPLWRNGGATSAERQDVAGLAQVHETINFAGLWAWVRGGGWGGPFVKNETWIDANVYAVPRLADDPGIDLDALARQWVSSRLKITDKNAIEAIYKTLMNSVDIASKGFYIKAFASTKKNAWHTNGDIIQDDVVDAMAAWRLVQRLPESILDEVVAEKQEVVDLVAADRVALQNATSSRNSKVLDPLVSTLMYAESLFEMLRDLLAGLIAYRRWLKSKTTQDAEVVKHRLLIAQSHWNHHCQRHGAISGTATAFREAHFWELTQKILTEISA